MSDKTQLLFLAFFLLLIGCGADSDASPTPTCLIPTHTPRPTTTLAPNPNTTATSTSTPEATPSSTMTLTPTPSIFCTPTPTDTNNGGGGGNGTPIPQTTPNPRSSTATDGTGVDSLTIDAPDQTLLAVGAGARTTAVAWQEGDALFLSQTIGATQQIAKRLAVEAGQITLAYDGQDRLHAVWEADGRLHYAHTTSPNQHLADTPSTPLFAGANPVLHVWNGRLHLILSQDGSLYHTVYENGDWTSPTYLADGENATVTSTLTRLFTVVERNGHFDRLNAPRFTLYTYSQTNPTWQLLLTQSAEGLQGVPHLTTDGEQTIALAWTTAQLDPIGDEWPRRRPEYKPAAPFINRIHSGDNAQQYFTSWGIHDAGIYQQFDPTAGTPLVASAYYMGWSCGEPSTCGSALPEEPNPASGSPANMRAQLCLDPQGGTDVDAPSVVCGGVSNAVDSWVNLQVTAVATSVSATLFLRTRPDLPRQIQNVYWDSVTLSGGALVNAGFDGGFAPYQGTNELNVAHGWTPFYVEDGEEGVRNGRYHVHTRLSHDNGQTWGEPQTIARNATPVNGKTGTIAPPAYPIIDGETLAVFFLYMEGDPLEGGVRYGRPSLVACDLTTSHCTPDLSGQRILPREVNRPAVHFIVASHSGKAVLAWDAYQSSQAEAKDIFTMQLTPSDLGDIP